jgi:uncharacterized DUF497 family protein
MAGRPQDTWENKTKEEAITVFADPLARIFDDDAHSVEERREIIIGHSAKQNLLTLNS